VPVAHAGVIEEMTRLTNRSPEEAKGQIEPIRTTLRANPRIARYVGEVGAGWDPLGSQVEIATLDSPNDAGVASA